MGKDDACITSIVIYVKFNRKTVQQIPSKQGRHQ
jgi:hypothetical protein